MTTTAQTTTDAARQSLHAIATDTSSSAADWARKCSAHFKAYGDAPTLTDDEQEHLFEYDLAVRNAYRESE